jgi:HEAT repeat protein
MSLNMMSQDLIDQAKSEGNSEFFRDALALSNDSKVLLFVLNGLGKLHSDFDASVLLPLTQHNNEDVQIAAIKNLGKAKDDSALSVLAAMGSGLSRVVRVN